MLTALGKHGLVKRITLSMLMQSHDHATPPSDDPTGAPVN
jgi:hypothetical protein